MSDSYHEKLRRVRKPRVHITYDVEKGDAVETKELPFVVGVMGDFSGDSTEPLKPLKERRFVQVDRDKFDQVMRRMTPGLKMRVPNTLKGDGSEFPVELKFNSMADFEPGSVVQQVEPLRRLLETRTKLRDLMTKVDSSEALQDLVEKVLKDEEQLHGLQAALAARDGSGAADQPEAGKEDEPR